MSKFDVDDALIRKLANLLKETGLTEIEYETDDARIRVNSGASGAVIAAAPAAVAAAPVAALTSPAAAADAPAAGSVSSPMVGTAYLSPEPNAARMMPCVQTSGHNSSRRHPQSCASKISLELRRRHN